MPNPRKRTFANAKNSVKRCLIIPFLIFSGNVFAQNDAQQEWWFNVEFIAFKRELLPTNSEDFKHANFNVDEQDSIDLLSLASIKQSQPLANYLRSMSLCEDATKVDYPEFLPPPIIDLNFTGSQNTQLPASEIEVKYQAVDFSNIRLSCLTLSEQGPLFGLARQPTQILPTLFAQDALFSPYPQLIDAASTTLIDYAEKVFRQRDISPLIHTAWRQEVQFGIDKAPFFRVIAGKLLDTNNTPKFLPPNILSLENEDDTSINSSEDFFEQLQKELEDNTPVDWLSLTEQAQQEDLEPINDDKAQWELDGLFKVYLDYVNQVPYLHIESEFKHHRLSLNAQGDAQLDVYPFKQRRRIISKQIHYFDHPAFGIIVRLERFTPPVSNVSLSELLGQ